MTRFGQRLTIRTRLTLVYGGLFLLAGLALLTVTYLLLDIKLLQPFKFTVPVDAPLPGAGNEPDIVRAGPSVVKYLDDQAANLRHDTRVSLLTQGAIALTLVGASAIALGWLIAGRVLAPLHRITDTARRIASAPAAAGLHERVALGGPDDEVRELADTFDAMLVRLDHAFDGQRRFVANASHELRTPLTLNRSLVELAMHRRTASADVKQLGEVLLDINARHERLINGLLLLAQTENEIIDRRPVDLGDVVEHVAMRASAEAHQAGVTVSTQAGEAATAGDPVLLEQLAQNLIENGIRHNTCDGWVRVTSSTAPGHEAELEVVNSGPVVAPYEIDALFEPFRRGVERTRSDRGVGLGLSLVRSIARAHGGDVTAHPRAGGGMTVTVTLPGPAHAMPSDDQW